MSFLLLLSRSMRPQSTLYNTWPERMPAHADNTKLPTPITQAGYRRLPGPVGWLLHLLMSQCKATFETMSLANKGVRERHAQGVRFVEHFYRSNTLKDSNIETRESRVPVHLPLASRAPSGSRHCQRPCQPHPYKQQTGQLPEPGPLVLHSQRLHPLAIPPLGHAAHAPPPRPLRHGLRARCPSDSARAQRAVRPAGCDGGSDQGRHDGQRAVPFSERHQVVRVGPGASRPGRQLRPTLLPVQHAEG